MRDLVRFRPIISEELSLEVMTAVDVKENYEKVMSELKNSFSNDFGNVFSEIKNNFGNLLNNVHHNLVKLNNNLNEKKE